MNNVKIMAILLGKQLSFTKTIMKVLTPYKLECTKIVKTKF